MLLHFTEVKNKKYQTKKSYLNGNYVRFITIKLIIITEGVRI